MTVATASSLSSASEFWLRVFKEPRLPGTILATTGFAAGAVK